MTSDETTHDLITRFYQAVNDRDFVAFASLLDEQVEFLMIGSTALSGAAHNREDMLAVIARVGQYTDENFIHLEEIDRIVNGNRGVMRSNGTAKTRQGKPYQNTYLHMIRVKGEVITEFIEYLDTDLINRVLLAD